MGERYAVYYAPPAGHDLWRFGCRWLGRDPETGAMLDQPAVPGLEPGRLATLTASPRLYGFHGTLKPPMRLADGWQAGDLRAAVVDLAVSLRRFEGPRLTLRAIGSFLALVPDEPSAALDGLAAHCVTELDRFRARPTRDEFEKRLSAGLTPRQQELLAAWGYPYVLDAFRFHLTLTGRLEDADRALIEPYLRQATAALCGTPMPVAEIALFRQPGPGQPFDLIDRVPLEG
ncbi:DUF1045 domain-containing protein [Arenibaculum pallidiluteum]|uniref:DUF1045 domain-containing protein n=1 Tax=Arenibaculum pallidiluteum TaxID=2812559 RepID=UPI001A95E3FD|nr:DUF1045 domain-containing protein [Arenibaculum pallidiluteum]